MDMIEKIRQLLALMAENGVAELEVEEPELRVKIKTVLGAQYSDRPLPHVQQIAAPAAPEAALAQPAQNQKPQLPPKAEDKLLKITSPMVGTFYRAPSEGAESYVTVGSTVEPDTVVCIVEAMKVMNELKAEVSGEIVEILVQNAEPVEYGQVLFLVKPLEE